MRGVIRLTSLFTITLMILAILQLSGIGYSSLSVAPVGVQKKVGSATWSSPWDRIRVNIPLTEGDKESFANPVTATIDWDYSAAIAAVVIIHKMALKDDANHKTIIFVDAVSGGTYKKTTSYHNADGYVEYYIIHKIFRHLGKVSWKVIVEKTFYVEASTEAEAEAKVGIQLWGMGINYAIKQTIKQGNYYAVKVSLELKRNIFYFDYEVKMERVYITPEGQLHKEYRVKSVCPQVSGFTI